ncbi:hypothetical protein K461DRAFT_275078 [Myriangium duriaei CBS 260.36]|uniref:14-3-3 domain-containing protein n=1 Tax=Myriangium duriaei CBS 260.36 TaxID=1168546 RepID=A0A9P4J5Y4_9PEZI|nr:hypothetical protein K461DRAFT_275078 [Myriangium duriaei CBS 260.36]
MAASDIDQKILGRIAKDAGMSDPSLSAALYQVLGLSVILSQKLYRAGRVRRLDITRDTKSIRLYHQIIWLSREGLAITEVLIIPYCQSPSQPPKCRVMAAKLRASFYHVFCLFHNQPPISLSTPPKLSPNDNNTSSAASARDVRPRTAVLRETIPSMASEASYITNPFALSGPAQTSPPPYPPPPVPALHSPSPRTPLHPPGLQGLSPIRRSPPSTADFIMPPLDFVPATAAYFTQANTLARQLLSGSDPLRLSIAYESCAFTLECAKDMTLARDRAKSIIRAVYADPEPMEDSDFQDAAALVQAIAIIAKRIEMSDLSIQSSGKAHSPSHVGTKRSPAQATSRQQPAIRVSPVRPRKQRSRKMQRESLNVAAKPQATPNAEPTRSIATATAPSVTPSGTVAENTALNQPEFFASTGKSAQQSNGGSQGSSTGNLSEKERKRWRVEMAEQDLERRRNSASQASSAGRAS